MTRVLRGSRELDGHLRGRGKIDRPHWDQVTSRLRRWFADASQAHSQQVNILVLGDSVAAGASADAPTSPYTGTLGPGRWIEVLLRRMQQAYGTGRGSPYMPARYNFSAGSGMNWTHSGTGLLGKNNDGGLGLWAMDIGANTSNYLETYQECDRFQIFYPYGWVGGMGDFAVKVDGDTIATVDIPQSGATWANIYDSGPIGPGRHTIRIQTAATGIVAIEGGIFYSGDYGTGIHVYDASHGGVTSQYFVDNTVWGQSVTPVAPSLVIYNLGLNDLIAGTSISTFKANIATTLDTVRTNTSFDPSELILIPHAHAFESLPTYPEPAEADWLPYRQAMYEVAEDRGAAVLDGYDLMGYAKAASDTADLFTSDAIHPNERGHRMIGNAVADALIKGPSDRAPVRLVLPAVPDVRTPPTGFGDLHLYPFAGRPTPTVRMAVGQPSVAGVPFNKTWVMNQPTTGAVMGREGAGADGTATGTVTTQSLTAFTMLATAYATAATNNAQAGNGDSAAMWWRGTFPLSPNAGFFFYAHVVLSSLAAERVFLGFTSGTAVSTVSAADPGNHHVGFSYITGTANWQFSSRDGTTNSKQDTGFAAVSGDLHEFAIWCPGGSSTVSWQIRNLGIAVGDATGTIPSNKNATGSKTTNLPAAGTTMRRAWAVQTTEAVAKTLQVARLYCESDR